MRILIISTFFPPLNSIASLRPYSWAKYWTLAGHHVEVVTTEKQQDTSLDLLFENPGFILHELPLPNWIKCAQNEYRLTEISKGKNHTLWLKAKEKLIRGFQILRRKTGIFNSCRMPDLTEFWIKPAFNTLKKMPSWDLIISTAGPYPVHVVASKLKRIGKTKRWIADYRDRWSDSCIYPGLFPFSFIEKVREKQLLKNADLITTVSDPFTQFYIQKYGNRVRTIENGMDAKDLESLESASIFNEDGKFRIIHTGSFYENKRDPSLLFEAIATLQNDQKNNHLIDKLELIFAGPNQGNLKELITKYKVQPWVKTVGFINRKEALRMQRDAHVLLFLPWNDPGNDGNLTGKIFEYLYSRTPILVIGGKTMEVSQRLIIEAKAGTILSSVPEIINYLKIHLKQPQKLKNTIDPDLLKRYDRQVLAMKLLEGVL